MEKQFIVGIDEGTTSVRAVLYNVKSAEIVCEAHESILQSFPKAGFVEQDAKKTFDLTLKVLEEVLKNQNSEEIFGIGITNQRETVVAWNKKTGEPICPAIVWQCRRTSEICKKFSRHTLKMIKKETGLICDAYFSATKMQWILNNVPLAKKLEEENNLCFGTIDSFLAYKLTNNFVTDTSNASRTMLMSLKTLSYSPKMLKLFGIKETCLPKIIPSCFNIGNAKTSIGEIPVLSIIGDQQSALFAETCGEIGKAKCTFGTGTFILTNTGSKAHTKSKNLITTVAYTIGKDTAYALEGSVFNSGTAVDWLKNNLQIISSASETEDIAKKLPDNGGVYFVPAFTGLGSPQWDSYARGIIVGLERTATKEHIVRACLEGLAFSANDILSEIKKSGTELCELKCNGGGAKNGFVMQFLSNITGVKVLCKENSEQTVLGAIYLAGLASGAYKNNNEIKKLSEKNSKVYKPNSDAEKNKLLIEKWNKAILKSKNWVK